MSALNALHRTGTDRVAVIGICTDADPDGGNAGAFVQETGAAYPVVADAGNALAGRLAVEVLPWCVLLDGQGRVCWQGPEPPTLAQVPTPATARGPATRPERVVHKGTELGTTLAIVVEGADRPRIARDIAAAIAEIRRAEGVFSTWRTDTELARVNRTAADGPVAVSPELYGVLAYARELAAASDGAFDPTVGSLVHAWGFDTEAPAVPEADAQDAARARVDWRQLQLDSAHRTVRFAQPGVRVDLGGLAKGYIADLAYRALRQAGHTRVLVNLGGDLRASAEGPEGAPWSVSVEDPDDPTTRLCVLAVRDRAVATSGGGARYAVDAAGDRQHHLLDPRTGQPATACRSVTIVAPDAIVADGLATAVFVLGPDRGLALVERLADVEAIVVAADGTARASAGLRDALAR